MSEKLDDDHLTAYHEAGHAVIGYVLGGTIERIQLGGEGNGNCPQQFGDCLIRWEGTSDHCNWNKQREILTLLAGPVAEMIYRGEKLHPAIFGPWQMDWKQAMDVCAFEVPDINHRTRILESMVVELLSQMRNDNCWAAIASVADELLAHEYLEMDQLQESLEFWIGRG